MGEGSRPGNAPSEEARPAAVAGSGGQAAAWMQAVPVLRGKLVELREPRLSDAAPLWALVTTEEVTRFMSTPPATVAGFERFIEWTQRERAAGRFVCFAVVPHGSEQPVGLFQIRRLDPTFESAEWGFALGSGFWSTGIFADSAAAVLDFAFGVLGVRRLEARAAVANGRGNGALRKVGARRERVLPGGLLKDGRCFDQGLWTIAGRDWRRSRLCHDVQLMH